MQVNLIFNNLEDSSMNQFLYDFILHFRLELEEN